MLTDFAFRREFVLGFLASFRYYVVYPLVTVAIIRMGLRRQAITPIIKGVILLGVFEGALGLLGFLGFIGNTYYAGEVASGSYPRAIGTLGNPNNFGLFLGLPAMLVLHRVAFTSVMARILLGAPIALGMALSFSKTAVLAFFLAVMLQRSTGSGTSARYLRTALIGVLGIGLAYLVLKSRTATPLTLETVLGFRAQSIPAAYGEWTASVTKLFLGNGFGYLTPSQFGGTGFVVDNMLLALALEGGAFAVAAFVVMVGSGLRLGMLGPRSGSRSAMETGLWGYLLYFLCYTLIVDNFRLFPGALLFWLALGLLVCWRSEGGPEIERDRVPQSPRNWGRPTAAG
jgi:hypothetical protein